MRIFLALKLTCTEYLCIRHFPLSQIKAEAHSQVCDGVAFIYAVAVPKAVAIEKNILSDQTAINADKGVQPADDALAC